MFVYSLRSNKNIIFFSVITLEWLKMWEKKLSNEILWIYLGPYDSYKFQIDFLSSIKLEETFRNDVK